VQNNALLKVCHVLFYHVINTSLFNLHHTDIACKQVMIKQCTGVDAHSKINYGWVYFSPAPYNFYEWKEKNTLGNIFTIFWNMK
jgi:hypothetical protein